MRELKSVTTDIYEEDGNVWYSERGDILLQLAAETEPRHIATRKPGYILIERDRAKHWHRKFNGYGIGAGLLRYCRNFPLILLRETNEGRVNEYLIETAAVYKCRLEKYVYPKDGKSYEWQYFVTPEVMNARRRLPEATVYFNACELSLIDYVLLGMPDRGPFTETARKKAIASLAHLISNEIHEGALKLNSHELSLVEFALGRRTNLGPFAESAQRKVTAALVSLLDAQEEDPAVCQKSLFN